MSDFMDAAKAVEPVVRMLDNSECGFASAVIFEDGSGSIIVHVKDADTANDLLAAHGVTLAGYQDYRSKDDYRFDIDLDELKKYSETLCPHCGKDTLAVTR